MSRDLLQLEGIVSRAATATLSATSVPIIPTVENVLVGQVGAVLARAEHVQNDERIAHEYDDNGHEHGHCDVDNGDVEVGYRVLLVVAVLAMATLLRCFEYERHLYAEIRQKNKQLKANGTKFKELKRLFPDRVVIKFREKKIRQSKKRVRRRTG